MAKTSRKPAAGKTPRLTSEQRIVVLHGKEPFQIRFYTEQLVETLTAAFGEVEQFRFDGETAAPADVLDELRSYGLLQRHKLVILDNADRFLVDDSEGGSSRLAPRKLMERYAADPMPEATLLMRAETWRPGNLDKAIAKVGLVHKFAPPTEAWALKWCEARCSKRYDARLEPSAAELLVRRIGPELTRLDSELAKLSALVGEGGTITRDHVAEMVGLTREEQAWEIQSAILTGRPREAIVKFRELTGVSQQPEVMISWAMIDLARKIHGAAHLLRQGVPAGVAARRLRLWGSAERAVMSIAERIDPDEAAALLHTTVETDRRTKSGYGDQQRTLESLAVHLADTVGSVG